ncbi:MAG: signal recognition particle protein [Sphingobacteriia bacterium]|nr:signal recognition particle protein [Sphingobacteriia bacterium]
MFDSLSSSLSKIFDKITRKGKISEDDFNQAAREIRIAMLEADVALPVIKEIIEKLKEKALGANVIATVSPAQMIIKILNDLIVEVLGSEKQDLNLNTTPPAVILMVGLQGAGKTTTTAKLALKLKNERKKVLLASIDTYRPAAQEQLQILSKKIDVACTPIISDQKPIEITKRALKIAKEESYDVLILDSAGRLHTDQELIDELKEVKAITTPVETLLVADSMTGQDAVNIAKEFNEQVGVTGIILTRMDGDARGGAALSMRMVAGSPIKFMGVGEKIDEFETFHPDRITSRILGMGDIVSLVERAASQINEKEAEKVAKKVMQGHFDMNDLASQIKNMKKMGGMGTILNLLPGMKQIKEKVNEMNVNEKVFDHQLAIISSMTKQERRDPKIINGSRRKRIAQGSGRTIQEVNKLLNNFEQMQKMMKQFKNFDPKKLMRSGLGNLFPKN